MSGVGSRRRAAELFVQQWAGHGYEKGETHSFWLSLLQDVLGMREVSTKCRFEQRTRAGGFIDVVIPSARTIVEQKIFRREPRSRRAAPRANGYPF